MCGVGGGGGGGLDGVLEERGDVVKSKQLGI